MFLRLLLSSWRARRARLLLALIGVTLGVAVTVALATLALEVGDDLARSLRAAGPNFVALPAGASLASDDAAERAPRAEAALPESSLAGLKQGFWKNNVLEAAPELLVPAKVEGVPVTLRGTWFEGVVATPDGPWRTGLAQLHPQWRIGGRWPREGHAEIALGRALAAQLGRVPDQWLTVSRGGRSDRWLVTAVVEAGGLDDRRAWVPLDRAQAAAGRPGQIDRVWLSALVLPMPRRAPPDPGKAPEDYERWMCTAYPPVVAADVAAQIRGAEVVPMTEVVAGESQVVGRLNLLMLLLALAALAAATLGLLSTTTATVVERAPELGLLRALGAEGSQIAALLLGETVLVAVPGGALGWLLGSLAARLIRGDSFGVSAPSHPLLLPAAIAASLALALLGTLGPLRFALRIDPVRVLRP